MIKVVDLIQVKGKMIDQLSTLNSQLSTLTNFIPSKLLKPLFITAALVFASVNPLYCEPSAQSYSFEFVNQDIRDIVYILSLRSGQSIICDDTVSGSGSFMYAAKTENSESSENFDKVFDAFLYTNKLLVIKDDGLWTVTKIKVSEEEGSKISVKSYDSTLSSVFEKISEKTGKSVIYETLPVQRTSINIRNQSVYDTVRLMLQPYSDYSVSETASGVQVTKIKGSQSNSFQSGKEEESLCNISFANGSYDAEIKNERISVVLSKIFMHTQTGWSDFLVNDERVKDITFTSKPLEKALLLVLEQVNAQAVFMDELWYIFPKNQRTSLDSVTQRNTFWHIKKLKNINTADLLESLPPGVSKEEIILTGTGNTFFYRGSEEDYKTFCEQLEEIDVPRKLVRYDLLILQYEKSSNLSWGISSSVQPSKIGDRTLLTGEIGNLLNINFDAITAFGLTFSEKINTALSENKAAVFADTTLYGLSGEKITFKNTNTYRYKDASIDPATGKEAFSTVTREITSGLVLEIDGWVSGDGIITMQINTSVSKQGIDVSKKNGNPPPTSEKNITTKIRARNGESVVLSGLSQNDFSEGSQGVPYLSKIPILGNLFKSKDVSETKTEMTIYLLPHIEEDYEKENRSGWKELLDNFLEEKGL